MATFKNRNGRWQAQVAIKGTRKSKSFDTKQDAMLWAATTEADILRGTTTENQGLTPSDSGSSHCFADALNDYVEIITPTKRGAHNERVIANRLLTEQWTHIPLNKLTLDHLVAFRDKRLKTIKPSTMKREWALVKSVVNKASNFGYDMPSKVFEGLTLPRVFEREITRVTDEDFQVLLDGTTDGYARAKYLNPAMRLALATAMRRGEIVSLNWSEVNFDKRFITVTAEKAKSGHRRQIPMTNEAYEALRELYDLNYESGSVLNVTVDAFKSAYKRLQRYTKSKVRFHDLRHESISRLHELGLTLPEIQSISGHRELEMLQRYSHASVSSLVAKMQGANND